MSVHYCFDFNPRIIKLKVISLIVATIFLTHSSVASETVRFRVTSDPSGADVYIDGQYAGTSLSWENDWGGLYGSTVSNQYNAPQLFPFQATEGFHKIVVTKKIDEFSYYYGETSTTLKNEPRIQIKVTFEKRLKKSGEENRSKQMEGQRELVNNAIAFTEQSMVPIQAGWFMMGSLASENYAQPNEFPQHRVTIKQFYISKYETTSAQIDACIADGGCTVPTMTSKRNANGRMPATGIDEYTLSEFVGWLTKKTGKKYRLPTEAEWEYAARAGTANSFNIDGEVSTDKANYNAQGSGLYRKQVIDVGSFSPNQWGLYDMSGNVQELVQDCYHDSYNGAPSDGSAWGAWVDSNCKKYIVRGGGFSTILPGLRSAARGRISNGFFPTPPGVGFRLARDN